MGEKDSKNEGKKNGDGGKKDDGAITVVLKVDDIHCEGCAKKIKRYVYDYKGVESMERDSNKLTVVGKVDPAKLREKIEEKTKKKVELISPLPKKDKDGSGGDKKTEEKPEKKTDEKKNKEPTVSTVDLKMKLHCDGCIQRIRQRIYKINGVQTVTVDPQKEVVTVKGTMDVKALVPYLKEKLNKSVEIVPAKKDDGGGGNKKEKGGGGDKKDGDGGKSEEPGKIEGSKMEYHGYGQGYGYGPGHGYAMGPQGYGYGPGQGYVIGNAHAPQMFSDENPNACSIM